MACSFSERSGMGNPPMHEFVGFSLPLPPSEVVGN